MGVGSSSSSKQPKTRKSTFEYATPPTRSSYTTPVGKSTEKPNAEKASSSSGRNVGANQCSRSSYAIPAIPAGKLSENTKPLSFGDQYESINKR